MCKSQTKTQYRVRYSPGTFTDSYYVERKRWFWWSTVVRFTDSLGQNDSKIYTWKRAQEFIEYLQEKESN